MFDLDAARNEDEGIPFDFMFGGEKYTLPAQPDVLAASMFAVGNFYGGLQRMLGDEQWERIVASPVTMDQELLGKLLAAYKQHAGADVGESGASTSS